MFFAYGLLIPWLGLYADDQVFIWTFEVLREKGIFRYFTYGGNRPVWGLFYSLFVPLLGHRPEVWHIFGIFWFWVCGLLLYKLMDLLFPDQKKFALISAALFIIYPGMQLQFISLTFGHMWLILAFFLLSLILTILSFTREKKYLLFSSIAIVTSAINLLSFEYFIMLEFIRPFLIWFVLRKDFNKTGEQIIKTIKIWLPYFFLLLGVIIWRVFFFELQAIRYQISIVEQFKLAPFQTIINIIPVILKNIFWSTTSQAWGQALIYPFTMDWSIKLNLIYIVLSIILIVGVFTWLNIINFKVKIDNKSKIFFIVIGLFGLFFAGWPFWATGLNVEPFYWNSRFTMPFMIGMVFVLSGLISLIPKELFQKIVLSLFIGLAIGFQFQIANDFRRDWEVHNEILWQMNWRFAGLESGTTILSNDLPIKYFSDNTFSAELNWIAAKGEPKDNPEYLLGYFSEFIRYGLPIDGIGKNFKKDMTSTVFYGTTDKVLAINYRIGSCLRVLDPRLDPINPLLKTESQKAATISNELLINPNGNTFELIKSNYGENPIENECYEFQKAQLLRQVNNWPEIVEISKNIDFQSNIIRRDPMLSIVFLDGLLNTGEIERAVEISKLVYDLNPEFSPVLCKYFLDINKNNIKIDENKIKEYFQCELSSLTN